MRDPSWNPHDDDSWHSQDPSWNSQDPSWNSQDPSWNSQDPSWNSVTDISGIGYHIHTTQYVTDSSFLIQTLFTTYDPSGVLDISENLLENETMYVDDEDPSGQNTLLMNQIRDYAAQINCSAFHGKGTIDDYAVLFEAASNIANETAQMQLNVDVNGFNDFAAAADDLSALFQSFIVKLQSVNIINDTAFLTSIASALGRIVNLSKVFGQFKETVLQTTTIKIPKSTYDTRIILEGVMDEISCAMNHIQYFVDPSSCPVTLTDAELNSTEKNIIAQAVSTIDNWNTICGQGVTIAMANDADIQYIHQASSQLEQSKLALQTATTTLRSKIASFVSKISS